MSTKESSFSFLTSITLGNEVLPKKKPKLLSKSSDTFKTTENESKETKAFTRNKTPTIEISKKKRINQSAITFLSGISLGEENEEDDLSLSKSGSLPRNYRKMSFEDKPLSLSLSRTTPRKDLSPRHQLHTMNKESLYKLIKDKSSSKPSRLLFRFNTSTPFMVSSLNFYNKEKKAVPEILSFEKSKKGVSYGHLLPIQNSYDPYFLDNEATKPEKLKIVIKLSCYCGSIIPFSSEKDAKEEENEAFVGRHNWLMTDITLSKIRSSKRKLADIALTNSIDSACVGLAFVYLEKLILTNNVFKNNYKYVVPNCLLLAIKFYGPKDQVYTSLLKDFEVKFKTTSKEVLQNEFNVFKALNFSLSVQNHEIMPHLTKIQRDHEFNVI